MMTQQGVEVFLTFPTLARGEAAPRLPHAPSSTKVVRELAHGKARHLFLDL